MRIEQEDKLIQNMRDLQWMMVDRQSAALLSHRSRNKLSRYALSDACREKDENPRSMHRVTQRDNPTLKSISRLANVLGVKLEWLLAGDLQEIQWEENHE